MLATISYLSDTMMRLGFVFLASLIINGAIAIVLAVKMLADLEYPGLTTPEARRKTRQVIWITAACAVVSGLLFVFVHD